MHQKQTVRFDNGRGQQLSATLDLPAQAPRAWALFAPCFTCDSEILTARRMGRALAANGIAMLRLDITGLGASEGDFTETSFTTQVEDLQAAAQYLQDNYSVPALLIGHSLGGTAALAVALSLPAAKAVVTLNAPADPAHLLEIFSPLSSQLAQNGKASLLISGKKFTITQAFVDDLQQHHVSAGLSQLSCPLLVMHVTDDDIVAETESHKLFAAAGRQKSFIALNDMDHLLTGAGEVDYVAELICSWAARYL